MVIPSSTCTFSATDCDTPARLLHLVLFALLLVCVLCRYWDTRPTAVITRIMQLLTIAGSFLSGLAMDIMQGACLCEGEEGGGGGA